LIPPFAFAGQGGRSRYIVAVDYKGFEPRLGFAWRPRMFKFAEKHDAVIRGGYGLSHATLTGNNRTPNPDLGGFTAVSTSATGSTAGSTADPNQPVRLTGNPPTSAGAGTPLATLLGTTPDGLVFLNGIGVPGVADAGDRSGRVPYSQNWNLSLAFNFGKTAIEVAYVGNKGSHLYLPPVNINPRDINFVESLEAQNINAETTFADPLGRRNLLGAVVTVQRNSVTAPYFGFGVLNRYFDPSASSIRHAGYIDVRRRLSRGLSFTANYTYGKSIDNASDSSPDVRVLTTGTTLGQVSYGAPLSGDRSISAFDIKHYASMTFVWDLPVGKNRWLLHDAPGVVNVLLGGWTVSGLARLQGGGPYLPFITDTNRLGGVNRTVRLDIIPGVPLKNPLWNRNCPIGSTCEPYINPSAFMRPAKGSLGNAPRTLDVRSPMQEFLDLSVQKNFPLPFIGAEGKRKIQFRVDFNNAFNHPNFRFNNTGNQPFGYGTLPAETDVTAAEFTAWQNANPGKTATLAQVNALLAASRSAAGALPLDFFRVPVPQGFATTNQNTFDITTLSGLKLYRLRQTYDASFGSMGANTPYQPRYIQFGLKVFF